MHASESLEVCRLESGTLDALEARRVFEKGCARIKAFEFVHANTEKADKSREYMVDVC